jgi:hypothetical protein
MDTKCSTKNLTVGAVASLGVGRWGRTLTVAAQNTKFQKLQLFIEFHFILLNNLKFAASKIWRFLLTRFGLRQVNWVEDKNYTTFGTKL